MSRPVILLHGLGRTRLALWPLARFLRGEGFEPVVNLGYFGPAGLTSSVDRVARSLDRRLPDHAERPVDFVTHSMGGIVARAYLGLRRAGPPGRLVQLAPPNQGAALADQVRRVPLLEHVPALSELGAESPGEQLSCLPPLEGWEVGVIAGRSFGPWHEGQPGDGVVRVAETRLPEARDWIVVPRFHTVIMNGQDARANVVAFLRTGRFLADAERVPQPRPGQ